MKNRNFLPIFAMLAFFAISATLGQATAQTPEPKMISIWAPEHADTTSPVDLTELVPYDSAWDRFALPGLRRGEFKFEKFADRLELGGIPVPINSGWDYADTKRIAEFFNLFGDAAYQQGYRDTVPVIDSTWLAGQRAFWDNRLSKGGLPLKRTAFIVFFGEGSECMAMRISGNPAVPPAFKFFEWPTNMTLADLKTNGTISEKAYTALTATGATDLAGLWADPDKIPKKYKKTVAGLFARYKFTTR